MANYRVNKNTQSPNYDHEVHKEGCKWWPTQNYIDLGEHASCVTAVAKARREHYSDSNGCNTCSKECHSS
jgi:hypothetical protein